MKKNTEEILAKLQIEKLNEMQIQANLAINKNENVLILSPTGSGKTLAFLLPIIENLDKNCPEVQVLIVVPSRELALQIENVARLMGTGYKINAIYGGRSTGKDKMDLQTPPSILIATPGRIADHLRRNRFNTDYLKFLVLDEFDKSLEIGFEKEMIDIMHHLPKVEKKILTSATRGVGIPDFVSFSKPVKIDFLNVGESQLKVKQIISPSKDKLETLAKTLDHLGNNLGIIFCNYKESIDRVSQFLDARHIPHGCFYGGMEQKDRERALIKFRNGTYKLLLATDLAARGIDVPEIKFIIHYHLPPRHEEYIHRNGRTARMNADGTAYVLRWKNEPLPSFIGNLAEEVLTENVKTETNDWTTVFLSGGRGDKISKGDIVGFFVKQGNITAEEIGNIELKQDCAFIALKSNIAQKMIDKLNNSKLKTKKVRLNLV